VPVKNAELSVGSGTKNPFIGGLNLLENESNMSLTDSPDCLNVMSSAIGSVRCREGQSYVFPSLGNGKILNFIVYKDMRIFGWGRGLFKQTGNSQPILITNALSGISLTFWVFNATLYMVDTLGYYQYDGTEFKVVPPYVPTIHISRSPDGTATTIFESLNLLSGQAIESFDADGVAKDFKLSNTYLNSIDKVTVNGTVMTSGFSTDLNNGTVTFVDAPIKGVNNVLIQFNKNSLAFPQYVYNCKYSIGYAGIIWISGNSNRPNVLWKSSINTTTGECNYFPALGFSPIGNDDSSITGFSTAGEKIVIFKEKEIHYSAPLNENGAVSFVYQLLSGETGCNIPYSIQTVNGNAVFANTETGVWVITNSNVIGEKTVKNVSAKINGSFSTSVGLLYETNLTNAKSFDYRNKYYLAVNGNCYVWDYNVNFTISNPEKLSWWKYNNIHAECFAEITNENGLGVLAYGHSNLGVLVEFTNLTTDFGQAIPQHFTTPLLDFGYPERFKTLVNLYLSNSPNTGRYKLEMFTEKRTKIFESDNNKNSNTFDWNSFSFDSFSWTVYRFPVPARKRIGGSNTLYFQFKISCNSVNDFIDLHNYMIQYRLRKLIRKG
jgi:hypothetical protein